MKLPLTIENGLGEKLTFLKIEGSRLIVENEVSPGMGPPMHIHHLQDEGLTVISGKMGWQIQGQPAKFAGPGESVDFKAGEAHKFWAEGNEVLRCTGYITPPDNIVYFLSAIYKSTRENAGKPGAFDGAWLLKHFKSEFDMVEIPGFVKKIIFPVVLFFGKLTGKHKKFADAPAAVHRG
jgi:mannose-6-phosphate isomerase-like protein (cupin superfamily)